MPQRAPVRQAAPAEILNSLNLGYNGYTDPTLTNPKMWAYASNVFSGAFGYIQRCRFATVLQFSSGTGAGYGVGGYGVGGYGVGGTGGGTGPFSTFKYFALPGIGAYLLADVGGQLWSFDTSNQYAQTQRFNPYVDPTGVGSSLLNGPWSRETLQNISYEMNGQVKQSGRLANAATIEGFGLDAPDTSPAVVISAGGSQSITSITRSGGIVTATMAANTIIPGGNGVGVLNVQGVTDSSFNGTFLLLSGNNTTTLTWAQGGQSATSSGGTVNNSITKAVGRSYAWAWENANKSHLGAPSPGTQYIAYTNQNGVIQLNQVGTVTVTNGSNVVLGSGTLFTSAWVGRSLWVATLGSVGRITAVISTTTLTLATAAGGSASGQVFQIYDPQATHIRLYQTADGQAVYLQTQRNTFAPSQTTLLASGLQFFDNGQSEPPSFPYTTFTAQANNLPPPVGQFINEYQGRLVVYGVPGAPQSFFYSNQESTSFGLQQESFAPLNQVTLPIANAQMNGMLEFPGSAVIWSDKQDMFRLTGLLVDNTVTGIAQATAAAQQGAQISRLPYALGCASPFAADITPLGGIWVSSNAEVWLYTDRYAPRNIGRPVQDILNSIYPPNLNLARAKYYHNRNRNWFLLAVPANGASYNNTLLVLDLDLLASNGSPSYFTFDMATNSPSWFVFNIRCDSIETVYENAGVVRLLTGQVDIIQDADYQGGAGTEIAVPNASVTLHAWGNDSPMVIKRPTWLRFNTNQDPSQLQYQGWSFQANGIDDDFYTFFNPLQLVMTPGVNDSSTLGGNPDFYGGLAFRHSPELFRVSSSNFVMGRRMQFTVNFPSAPGANYQFRGIQIGFGVNPPN